MRVFNTLTKQILERFITKNLNRVGSDKEVRLVFPRANDDFYTSFNMSLEPSDGKYTMFINLKMFETLNNNQFLACVAHELGHLFHNRFNVPFHQREYIADRMAIRFGSNPQDLIDALIIFSRGYRTMISCSSESHPSVKQRAAALNISSETIDRLVKLDYSIHMR